MKVVASRSAIVIALDSDHEKDEKDELMLVARYLLNGDERPISAFAKDLALQIEAQLKGSET